MVASATASTTLPASQLVSIEGDNFLLSVPPEAHTLAGFRKWALSDAVPEKLRVCFIGGKPFLST